MDYIDVIEALAQPVIIPAKDGVLEAGELTLFEQLARHYVTMEANHVDSRARASATAPR